MGDFLRSEETMLIQELGNKALEDHYGYMKSFPDLKPTFDNIEAMGLSLPTYQINHLCKFIRGFLLFITYDPVPEAHDIFKRSQKYLNKPTPVSSICKKQKPRSSEAKVEAALERVRSRTMGMQQRDELREEAAVYYIQQVVALGVPAFGSGVLTSGMMIENTRPGWVGRTACSHLSKLSSSEDIFLQDI